jgi:hypothetical protein
MSAPPYVAPYHEPPAYPPPAQPQGPAPTDGKAIAALLFGILGLVFGIPLGLPGMIAGPIAYFLGKGARQRIKDSKGTLGGASFANAGRILGIIAMAVGSVAALVWLILIFNALNDTSGAGTGF